MVAADERESGLRAILNYGHTIGHALEAVTGYNRYKHGEAVIMGMIAAGRIAVRKGLMVESDLHRQNRLLNRIGATLHIDDINTDKMLDAMTRDKKVVGGRIRFILPHGIGKVCIHDDVNGAEIKDALDYLVRYFNGR